MKQKYIKITSRTPEAEVNAVYDISKLALASKQNDKEIRVIIDGVEGVWSFASREDRDRNLNEICTIIDLLQETND